MVKVKLKAQSSRLKAKKDSLQPRASSLQQSLFDEAKRYIPGGVNSPVRSFKAVDGSPVFIKRGSGSRIFGEEGEEFIDYCLSWGALILGHAHKEVVMAVERAVRNGTSFGAATRLEIELAKLIIEAMPSIELIRLTNSGTEAVMGAVRLARAYTGKDKIIKFQGSYHGHADYLLSSLGIPEDFTRHTISAPYNNTEILERTVEEHKRDLACIIVEPVAGNCGVVLPRLGFLEEMRRLADRHKAVLIFDEVITGFRVSYGGAQRIFAVYPDITCLGKIIGGGLPVGAFGGRKDIMDLLAPEGSVYQAGTLSGNPVAVTAGITTLKILKEIDPYKGLEAKTERLCEGIKSCAEKNNISLKADYIGSMFSISFGENGQDTGLFKKFFHGLLRDGIYFSPSGFEANFLSTAHTYEDIEKTLKAAEDTLKAMNQRAYS